MHGKHLKLVAVEESIHTLHSCLNVQLLLCIIKSRPICFSKKTSHHVLAVCNWASGSARRALPGMRVISCIPITLTSAI